MTEGSKSCFTVAGKREQQGHVPPTLTEVGQCPQLWWGIAPSQSKLGTCAPAALLFPLFPASVKRDLLPSVMTRQNTFDP